MPRSGVLEVALGVAEQANEMLVVMRCQTQLALTAQFRDAGGFKIEKLKYKTREIPRSWEGFDLPFSLSFSHSLLFIY